MFHWSLLLNWSFSHILHAGLQIKSHYGGFLQSAPNELCFAHLSADTSFSVEIEHTRSLSTRTYAYLQCAALYTSLDGRRRVRVINLALNVVELAGNVFQFADLETVLTHMAKRGVLHVVLRLFFFFLDETCSYGCHEPTTNTHYPRRIDRALFFFAGRI